MSLNIIQNGILFSPNSSIIMENTNHLVITNPSLTVNGNETVNGSLTVTGDINITGGETIKSLTVTGTTSNTVNIGGAAPSSTSVVNIKGGESVDTLNVGGASVDNLTLANFPIVATNSINLTLLNGTFNNNNTLSCGPNNPKNFYNHATSGGMMIDLSTLSSSTQIITIQSNVAFIDFIGGVNNGSYVVIINTNESSFSIGYAKNAKNDKNEKVSNIVKNIYTNCWNTFSSNSFLILNVCSFITSNSVPSSLIYYTSVSRYDSIYSS